MAAASLHATERDRRQGDRSTFPSGNVAPLPAHPQPEHGGAPHVPPQPTRWLISTIHYATPSPVHLNEGPPALRHPYVASSKSTCHATRFPLATPPPRTRAPALRCAPRISIHRPQSLVAHRSARGWPGFCLCQIAGHRHRRLERGAASSQQTAKRNGISNSKHRFERGIETNADQQHAHITHKGQHATQHRTVCVT